MASINKVYTKKGEPRWRVKSERTTPNGERIHAPSATFKTYAEAKAEAAKRELVGGTFGKGSLAAYLSSWVDYRERMNLVRPSTAVGYRSVIDDANAHIGAVPLAKLSVDEIEYWLAAMRERGVSAGSLVNYKAIISSALNDAVKARKIIYNPCSAARLPKTSRHGERVVPPLVDVRLFLDALDLTEHGLLYRLCALTGLRRGEAGGLLWDCVDLEGKQLHVRRNLTRDKAGEWVLGPPKTRTSERTVPLVSDAVRVLRRAKLKAGSSDFVFPGKNGGQRSMGAVSDAGRRVKRNLGLPQAFSPAHGMRNFFATMMLRNGTEIRVLQGILGHASPEQTMSYQKPDDDDRAQAMNAIDGLL
ncbi:tyrosine-type recombinase/integrase [Ruegeria arenilitoris]|uniref:tyrosine-type recombinase/integrase n=1 Tax=Ruegeria arenilitoris TaxID=1173585 RepID=UPI00147BA670|nr:site-specific integrase [Ruegeria arenilitoris]